ncbi:MAG: TRAP-type mannitol/chloroaromatic compound transport system, small permease component [uncultured Sulfurovum sp.]|uniref:TRAP-type mannitol/chloroaromatic compound transport system, small permease component n=1 Tax=uncultured Sulfurovum sp. TaxID=269237 RepID=A0A6S6TIV9_9BACT|nr:MAG: TRAP-type mannitol/chloroaromatic compound transport system, small permease component [uncultured Sulfurovum sp.]
MESTNKSLLRLKRVEASFNSFIDKMGRVIAWVLILMIFNVLFDVVMRYFFNNSSIAMQEVEWHLFSILILFGLGYALKEGSHVRVDFLYDNFSVTTKAYINIIGTLLFLFPFALLIIFGSYEYVMDAYTMDEISEDPGGLTHRWIVKAMIPAGFIFLLFAGLTYILKHIIIIKEAKV